METGSVRDETVVGVRFNVRIRAVNARFASVSVRRAMSVGISEDGSSGGDAALGCV
jgi:hypothetical protein